jgi:photosystem II stability/assembly factor-like uncharacterized protein
MKSLKCFLTVSFNKFLCKFIFTRILLSFLIIFLSSDSLFAQLFWTDHNTGVNVQLNSVSNINGIRAWVCGNNGTVFRTTDSGYNWINKSANGIPANVNLVNIYGVDTSIALTAGYNGSNTFVYRTSNGGNNWTQVFTQANGFINAIWLRTNTSGVMEGNPVNGRWSLWKTTNAGLNWDSSGMYLAQLNAENGLSNSLCYAGSKIWFGTNKSRIYYSSNSGINWSQQSILPDTVSYSIWFDSSSSYTGMTCGSILLKSTNFGNNWSTISAIGSGNFNSITGGVNYFYPSGYWYIRNSNNIYCSLNNGTTWNIQYTAPSGLYTHLSALRNYSGSAGCLYAARNNGWISRANLLIEGVRIISGEIPKEFKLYQNFPNPFNPSTRIKFELPLLPNSNRGEVMGSYIRIAVYDLTGKEIEVLVDEVLQPGIYDDSWNGTNYPSGIYFYNVTVNDPRNGNIIYRITDKMVLIK